MQSVLQGTEEPTTWRSLSQASSDGNYSSASEDFRRGRCKEMSSYSTPKPMQPPQDAKGFCSFLTKKYDTLERGWWALEKAGIPSKGEGRGALNYQEFVIACRRIRFTGAVQRIFDELCGDEKTEVTPEALHPGLPARLVKLQAQRSASRSSSSSPSKPRIDIDAEETVPQGFALFDRNAQTWGEVQEMLMRPPNKFAQPPADAKSFRAALLKRFQSLEDAWVALDASEDGALQFNEFVAACRRLQMSGNLRKMFDELCNGEPCLKPEALHPNLPERVARLKEQQRTSRSMSPSNARSPAKRTIHSSGPQYVGGATTYSEAMRAWSNPPDRPLVPPQDAKAFRAGLLRRFNNLELAWTEIDANRDGSLQFSEFVKACRRIEFSGNLRKIFNDLTDLQDELTPEKLDPSLPAKLERLRQELEGLKSRSPSPSPDAEAARSRSDSKRARSRASSRSASPAASADRPLGVANRHEQRRVRPSRRAWHADERPTPSPDAPRRRRHERVQSGSTSEGGAQRGGQSLQGSSPGSAPSMSPTTMSPTTSMTSTRVGTTPQASPRPRAQRSHRSSPRAAGREARRHFGGARRVSGGSLGSAKDGGAPPAPPVGGRDTYPVELGSSRAGRAGSRESAAWTFRGDVQGTTPQAPSLHTLRGKWRSADGNIWAIDGDGHAYLNGQHLGHDYDLSEEVGPGSHAIIRHDGWRVDMERSSSALLVWMKQGETSIEWQREELVLSVLVGHWLSDGNVWTIEPSGRALINGQHAGDTYDLVESVNDAGQYAIRRQDGWEVDLRVSSGSLLVWMKAGEASIEWHREVASSPSSPPQQVPAAEWDAGAVGQ